MCRCVWARLLIPGGLWRVDLRRSMRSLSQHYSCLSHHLFECLMACAHWIWANSAIRRKVKGHCTLIRFCSAAPWCSTVLVSFVKQTLTKNLVCFRKLYPFRRFWPPQFVFSYHCRRFLCLYTENYRSQSLYRLQKVFLKHSVQISYLHEICTPQNVYPSTNSVFQNEISPVVKIMFNFDADIAP